MSDVKDTVVSLGHCMARLREVSGLDDSAWSEWGVSLTIVSPSFSEDGMYEPAESVKVSGRDNLNNLLKLLQETIGHDEQTPKP